MSAGTCFRLVTREFYENALPEFGVPEMQVGSRTDSLPKFLINVNFSQRLRTDHENSWNVKNSYGSNGFSDWLPWGSSVQVTVFFAVEDMRQ